ncbi:N-acetylmuramoyl-L-alanine amidase family protein [Clostridium gasigenes]|uniref:N-acetylmuramoyl-L-alanine amidase family protein n=1 Tax=Clostridium gasigenes TaxID=94869 RepID=UPI001C0D672D|nr:N-acetylmuramoyl-L-alanine amidase [Clostridium gasigenes]MBU3102783.1 N-acetylmuramoyl-L-alanine amidase [Clostridium gasigenes]MBU3134900.1 N-acetylmuramoyl-L-alanine amidase [Clostridium gasigenes]
MKKIISTMLLSILIVTNLITVVPNALMVKNDIVDNKDFTICIDPGHQEKGDSKTEPIAPGSGQRKARVSSGTAGVATKKAEYIVNLEASIILKEILENKGYKVVMTRDCHDVRISNAERAEVANKCTSDLAIRIHCDSLNDSGKTGATILVPSKNGKDTKCIFEDSNKYGKILEKTLKTSGIKVNGVFERPDITGFNWSQVPVVIFEMGFMSNWNEDKMLSDPVYQKKLMEAVAKSIDEYKNEAVCE